MAARTFIALALTVSAAGFGAVVPLRAVLHAPASATSRATVFATAEPPSGDEDLGSELERQLRQALGEVCCLERPSRLGSPRRQMWM